MSKPWKIRLPPPPPGLGNIPTEIQGAGRNWNRPEIQRVLRAVRDCGNLICICRTDGNNADRALHSRKLPSADELTIARNSDTGPEHSDECYFFKERVNDSGRQCYVDDVIVEKEDGTILLRLATTLRPRKPKEQRDQPSERSDGRGARSQRAMTQRGFLDYLFDRAEINLWYPKFAGHRDPDRVLWKLLRAADDVRSAKKEVASHLAMCWPTTHKPPFARWAVEAKAGGFRGMVLGVVREIDDLGSRVVLEQQDAVNLEVRLDDVSAAHLQRSFSRELGMLRSGEGRVFGLFTCDIRYRNQFHRDPVVLVDVVDAALIAVEPASCIPVESSHELRMAKALIAANRSFRKPMRFDADDDVVFPDFILTDRGPRIAVEVWGREDELYLERRRAKEAYYAAEYPGRLIGWNAAAGDPLPRL